MENRETRLFFEALDIHVSALVQHGATSPEARRSRGLVQNAFEEAVTAAIQKNEAEKMNQLRAQGLV